MADALWTLSSLTTGRPGLTPGEAQSLMEAAAVCLADQGHGRLVQLRLTGEFQHTVELALPPVDESMRRTHADLPRAVERGACAIAALVCERQQGLVVAEQSRRGGGFDYWLAPADDDQPLFQSRSRLEVSGILKGSEAQVRRRMQEKLKRLAKFESVTPTWVMVVEFSRPVADTVRR